MHEPGSLSLINYHVGPNGTHLGDDTDEVLLVIDHAGVARA
jgi:hypothetical protein